MQKECRGVYKQIIKVLVTAPTTKQKILEISKKLVKTHTFSDKKIFIVDTDLTTKMIGLSHNLLEMPKGQENSEAC